MIGLDNVFTEFESDVERVEHLLLLIKSFREFGASAPPNQGGDAEREWGQARVLHGESKLRRTDLPILSGSLQLYLAGRFEFCIRQVIEVLADEIAARTNAYGDLPEVIRKELKARTLDVVQDPKRYGYDVAQSEVLLTNLVRNFSAIGPVTIDSAILSITESNMKDRVLADVFKRVGMADVWINVGKQTQMKLSLLTVADGETTATAIAKLNSIMEERNQVAHPTGSTNFPDLDMVIGAASFLKTLAHTIVELSKVHLSSPRPAGTASASAPTSAQAAPQVQVQTSAQTVPQTHTQTQTTTFPVAQATAQAAPFPPAAKAGLVTIDNSEFSIACVDIQKSDRL